MNPLGLLTDLVENDIWLPQYEQWLIGAATTQNINASPQTQYLQFDINPTTGTFQLQLDGVNSSVLTYQPANPNLIKYDIGGALSGFFGGSVPGGLLEQLVGGLFTVIFTPPYGTSQVQIVNNTTPAVTSSSTPDQGTVGIPIPLTASVTGPGSTTYSVQQVQPTTIWTPQYSQPTTIWTAQVQ